MKIAIYTHNLKDLGGIERVVREHLRIFYAKGAECLVFCEVGCDHIVPLAGPQRRAAVEALLREFEADCCILHGVSHQGANDDIAVCKALGIPVIAVCHFSFPSAMLSDGDEAANRSFLKYARRCDMVAPVSEIDTLWWRALGCRAMHVQNPFVHPRFSEKKTSTVHLQPSTSPVKILWVGRNCEQKRPDLAIEVLARVVRETPNVHLTMIGGSDAGWKGARRQATQLGIADKVTCLGQRDDLNDLWDKADIHLLTSVTESFCLVLAEAKAKGIPTAMFEIPFLELVESGKGLVIAPQGNVEALAAGIVELVKNPEKRQKLGEEARESLAAFNDEAVWQSWMRVFDALKTGEGGCDVDPVFKTIVAQQHFAWNRFCEKNLWAVQMVRDSAKLTGGMVTLRQFAKVLRECVVTIQKVKAKLRG